MAQARTQRAVLLVAVLAAASTARTQAGEVPPDRVFLDTAQVNLINVEVFAADPGGKPVVGLRLEDFELLEDGKPVAISNFFAPDVAPLIPAAAGGVPEQPDAMPPAANTPPLEQRLSLVLFVDNTGITPAQRNLALQRARALLDSAVKLPSVEVMVVAHGPTTRIRQGFTANAAALAKALEVISHEPTDTIGSSSDHTLLDRVLSLPSQTDHFSARQNALARESDATDARAALDIVRALAQEASEHTRAAVASIQQFVMSLAGLPGRKAICYIGNGIQLRPGQAMLQAWESRFGRIGVPTDFSASMEGNSLSVVPQFRALVSHTNADRVTFYSLDASGGAAPLAQSPEDVSPDPDPGGAQAETINRQYSLQYLAYATGGTTIASTPAASPALALITRDFEAFYSLAYVAPHIGDGRNHVITVKTTRAGVQLRYRRNYLDKTADDRMVERNLAALLYDSGSNALDVGVAVRKEVKQKRGVYLVPLLVTVPLGKLALLPHGEAQEGKVSIWVASKDGDDRISPSVKNSFLVRIATKELTVALAKKAGYSFGVLLRPGAQKLAISLRDDVSQAESTVTVRFSVGKGGKGAPEVVTGMRM
ncbi:MAG: VWA domain-containing protein [Thermoanaerobaculales bacterium]